MRMPPVNWWTKRKGNHANTIFNIVRFPMGAAWLVCVWVGGGGGVEAKSGSQLVRVCSVLRTMVCVCPFRLSMIQSDSAWSIQTKHDPVRLSMIQSSNGGLPPPIPFVLDVYQRSIHFNVHVLCLSYNSQLLPLTNIVWPVCFFEIFISTFVYSKYIWLLVFSFVYSFSFFHRINSFICTW